MLPGLLSADRQLKPSAVEASAEERCVACLEGMLCKMQSKKRGKDAERGC